MEKVDLCFSLFAQQTFLMSHHLAIIAKEFKCYLYEIPQLKYLYSLDVTNFVMVTVEEFSNIDMVDD